MKTLDQQEWIFLLQMILHLNMEQEKESFQKKFLQEIEVLIPHSKGVFMSYKTDGGKFITDSFVHYRPDGKTFNESAYLNHPNHESWQTLHHSLNNMVLRNSDLISTEEFKKSELYKVVYEPQNLLYSLKVVLVHNSRVIGSAMLCRPESDKDFSDKDIFILNIIKDHLTYKLSLLSSKNSAINSFDNFELTARELQVAELLCKHYSTNEICEKLFISPSTLSKHINHIYQKTGAKNRLQFGHIYKSHKR